MSDQALAGEALLALFQRAGYGMIEPPVLQPAELFLDLSGEEMRRRMFVTLDANGAELCLRPEYTIPVCRTHSCAPRSWSRRRFRSRRDGRRALLLPWTRLSTARR